MLTVTLKEVIAKPQVIADTMADKGVKLEKTCGGQGICGSCKCKKVSGDVHYLREAIAMFDESTEFLPCISVPKTKQVVISTC